MISITLPQKAYDQIKKAEKITISIEKFGGKSGK